MIKTSIKINYFDQKLFLVLFCLITFSCALKPNIETNGVLNLNLKQTNLEINKNNKNDVLKILGETIIKEFPDDRTWIYIETETKRNFFGKKKYTKNNILVINFDNKGILTAKNFLKLDDMKEINFDEELSKTYAIDNSFSKKFFASIKKRMQNQAKKFGN